MAKNAEASLLLRIKQQGAEALKKVEENLEAIRNRAALASTALTAFMGLTVKKFAEQEEAQNALTQSLTNQGLEVDRLTRRYTELAGALQDKTIQDDDAIVKGIALAQSYAGQLELTEDLIEATVDFAAATGTDLEQAFTMVGKSIGTNTNALARNGVQLDENATSSEKMSKITAVLTARFDGFAESQRKGLGELKAFGNTLDDLLVELGREYAPTVIKATKATSDFIKSMTANEDLVKVSAAVIAITAAIAGLTAGLITLGLAWGPFVAGLTLAATALTGPVGIAVGLTAVTGAAAYASGALDGMISKVKELAGLDAGPAFDPDNNEGDQKLVMWQRSKERMKQIADAEIAEANRVKVAKIQMEEDIAKERKKLSDEAAVQSIKDQQEAWEEMKKLKGDADKKNAEQHSTPLGDAAKTVWNYPGEFGDSGKEFVKAAAVIGAAVLEAMMQGGEQGAREFGSNISNAIGTAFGGPEVGAFFDQLFMFSTQTEEEINAQVQNLIDQFPEMFARTVEFAPIFVEAMADALADPSFWQRLAEAFGRAFSANTNALARQWGIESGNQFISEMQRGFGNLAEYLKEFFGGIFKGFANLFSGVGDILSNALGTVQKRLEEWFGKLGDGFADKIKSAFNFFGDLINKLSNVLGGGDLVGGGGGGGGGGGLLGKAKKALGFASGGLVPAGFVSGNIQRFAAGGTTDTVPAMLTPGEMVINKDATQKNLGLLQSINSGAAAGGSGVTINLTINGGFLGDESSARQLARAIDEQLLKLRQSNQSVAFERGLF